MSKKMKIFLIALESILLLAVIGLGVLLVWKQRPADSLSSTTSSGAAVTTGSTTAAPTTEETTVPETTAATEVTEPPQTDPPATEPEPEPERFLLSFAGDCTLGNNAGDYRATTFLQTVGDNYTWPFAGVLPYFEMDDFTMVNFEGTLTSSSSAAEKQFAFKAPAEYARCLFAGSIDCVNLANNHTYDYGYQGYKDTKAALAAEGIAYVGETGSLIYTTVSSLTIGIYADAFYTDTGALKSGIASLREKGAEIVIFSIHWGEEGSYSPTASMKKLAHTAIDAGADIVFGHHPHVLQPIEEYNGGIIYYSMGNFAFGGNTNPSDKDTAIIQQEVIRDPDGTVRLGQTTVIPCSVSSVSDRNDYQPTPLEEGTKTYDRVLEKLKWTNP